MAKLNKAQDTVLDEPDEVIPERYTITGYGAGYPVQDLVGRLVNGSIFIPSFQRGYVWNLRQASRFIESLLLGLPVPGIVLAQDKETRKLMVIDGQQRLRTLKYFYEGVFAETGREFALKGVNPQFEGIAYRSLAPGDRYRLDNFLLHATVIRQQEPSNDDSSIYHIFERLNTGGVQLQPQEIRSCIYHGELNDLLRELNQNEQWRSLYGPVNSRMRDQELILRFLALYFEGHTYRRPMKGFLNLYMSKNRHLTRQPGNRLRRIFTLTVETVHRHLGRKAFKPRRVLNAAVFDAVMVGLARRLEQGDIQDIHALQQQYRALLSNKDFLAAVETGTAGEENVKTRLELATQAFAGIP